MNKTITHAEFVKKYDGKFYNYDNAYWPECVDEFKWYYRDVKWFIIKVALGTAYNYWVNLEKTWLVRTDNPKEGDAVFSKYRQGKVELGHVGIFVRFGTVWGVKGVYQFDQLGDGAPNVGKEKPCKTRWYPLTQIYGYGTLPETDEAELRVQAVVRELGLKQPSKVLPYTQYQICLIISRLLKK